MLQYLHPATGGLVLLFVAYVGVLGLRVPNERWQRDAAAARHARLAPAGYWLTVASWISGLLSTIWLRSDLATTGTLHFRLGSLILLLLTGSALSARRMQRRRLELRDLHTWLGAAAVLTAIAHAVAGLGIMP